MDMKSTWASKMRPWLWSTQRSFSTRPPSSCGSRQFVKHMRPLEGAKTIDYFVWFRLGLLIFWEFRSIWDDGYPPSQVRLRNWKHMGGHIGRGHLSRLTMVKLEAERCTFVVNASKMLLLGMDLGEIRSSSVPDKEERFLSKSMLMNKEKFETAQFASQFKIISLNSKHAMSSANSIHSPVCPKLHAQNKSEPP